MEKVKESEMSELQKAREQNIRLDKEILALRNRVRFLDSERTIFLEREKKETTKSEEASVLEEGNSDHEDNQALHKRCCQVVESIKCQNAQLLHKLHKLEREHEDLVERNEELESLLGETQNQTRDEREQFECEVDELRKKISHLEAELAQAQESLAMANAKATKEAEDRQEVLKTHQEKVDVLENKLLEEEEWRKQLARDLEATQNSLKEEKKELQNSKSELLQLYSELQTLRGAAEERDALHVTHERLQKENVLLETKVTQLSQECEQLNQLLAGGRKHEEKCLASRRAYAKAAAKERLLEDRSQSWEKEREQLCLKLLECNKKMEELEKQVQGNHEEKQLLWEENALLRKDNLAFRHQLNTSSTVPVRLKHEAGFGEIHPYKPQHPMGSTDGEVKQGSPGGKAAAQPQHEALQQLRQDLQRVQRLCSSAEKELRYEREKNLELKEHNMLLRQENITAKAELRQAQQKLSDASKTCSSLTSQWELSRQKITELQRKLKEAQHQVQLSETHVLGRKQLEGELKEARENEMKAQRQLEEEQRKRKLLDQQVEEFQQQLRHSHEKETELSRASAELQVQHQQQAARLQVLEEEKRTLSNEHLHCQKYSQKLSEQLLALQEEKETLHSEFGHIMEQVDISIRKHNERKLRQKAKLRRAKETFISEVKQRDTRIRHLEDEIKLLKTQAEKEHGLIRQVTTANEGLHQEKRKLLQRLQDVEEERSNKLTLSTLQSRVRFLDEENKTLQEQILQLTTEVGVLQRALRSIHNHNLEELKSLGFSDCQLQRKASPPPKARVLGQSQSGGTLPQ